MIRIGLPEGSDPKAPRRRRAWRSRAAGTITAPPISTRAKASVAPVETSEPALTAPCRVLDTGTWGGSRRARRAERAGRAGHAERGERGGLGDGRRRAHQRRTGDQDEKTSSHRHSQATPQLHGSRVQALERVLTSAFPPYGVPKPRLCHGTTRSRDLRMRPSCARPENERSRRARHDPRYPRTAREQRRPR